MSRMTLGDGAGAMFVEEEPRQRECPRATDDERALAHRLPSVSFDADESYSERLEDYTRHLIRVACPNCGRECRPFIRRDLPKIVVSEWEWVGISYKQPFTDYLCACLGCGEPFRLHIYTPQ